MPLRFATFLLSLLEFLVQQSFLFFLNCPQRVRRDMVYALKHVFYRIYDKIVGVLGKEVRSHGKNDADAYGLDDAEFCG